MFCKQGELSHITGKRRSQLSGTTGYVTDWVSGDRVSSGAPVRWPRTDERSDDGRLASRLLTSAVLVEAVLGFLLQPTVRHRSTLLHSQNVFPPGRAGGNGQNGNSWSSTACALLSKHNHQTTKSNKQPTTHTVHSSLTQLTVHSHSWHTTQLLLTRTNQLVDDTSWSSTACALLSASFWFLRQTDRPKQPKLDRSSKFSQKLSAGGSS